MEYIFIASLFVAPCPTDSCVENQATFLLYMEAEQCESQAELYNANGPAQFWCEDYSTIAVIAPQVGD